MKTTDLTESLSFKLELLIWKDISITESLMKNVIDSQYEEK